MLKLRSIDLSDLAVFDGKQRIGRIRLATERIPCVWRWSVTIHLGGPPHGFIPGTSTRPTSTSLVAEGSGNRRSLRRPLQRWSLRFSPKNASGCKFPAHNHPTDEYVTVISGNLHVGMGDKLDERKAIGLTAGGYVEAPARMNHYGWVSSPSVVQIQAQGSFGITYVNPADDPSKL